MGCGGTGVVPVANMGPSSAGGISAGGRNAAPQQQAPSGTQNAPCPTCHETGIERILLYR